MKIETFFITFLVSFITSAYAQKMNEHSFLKKDTLKNSIEKPLQIIDVEILGPGLGISVIYDTKFSPKNNGLGLRAGLGLAFGITVPLSINYLIGNSNKRSFLELGAGVTVFIAAVPDFTPFYSENKLI